MVQFGGLVSGLDTGALIDGLVGAERASATTLTTRQSDITAQKSIISSLSTAVAALAGSARGLDTLGEVKPLAATLSESTKLAVAASSTAIAGNYDLRVVQLAKAHVTSSQAYASNTAGVAGTGGLAITVGTSSASITWDGTDTLDSIAAKINDANVGVSASVLFDGTSYRIVTAAKSTGVAGRPTFVDSGTGLDLANPGNVRIAAQDAIVRVNGIDVTRSSNTISDAVPGTTLTLTSEHAVADASTRLTIAADTKAITDKLKGFVSAYNAINSALHVQLAYTGTKKGTNTLFGDSTLRQLQQGLGKLASDAYGTTNLGAVGISRDKTGAMTLDESKLATALGKDPNAVAGLFVTGGLATAFTTLADTYSRAGDGLLATKSQTLTSRSQALQSQIDRINDRADALKTRLERQFGALEQAMSALQSQSSSMIAILGGGSR